MFRRMFMSFAVVGLLLGWSSLSRAGDDCKAILDKAIAAHGGAEKLAKIHAVKTKHEGGGGDGNIIIVQGNNQNQPTPVTETSYLFPDKYKSDTSTEIQQGMAFRNTTVYNQGKGTRSSTFALPGQDKEQELKEAELNEIKERIHRMQVITRLVDLKDAAYTLAPLPEEKIANKPAVGFKVKAKGHRDLDLFFDKASGLLVKTRYEREGTKGKKIIEETLIKEHQKVDGISVPKKIGEIRDGKEVKEIEYTETQLLPTMDEKEFDSPSPQ